MTKDDLISRQAAIDEITEYGSGDAIFMSVGEFKRRIEHLPSAQPVDKAYLCDWYINSVTESEPVWTEAHISELMGDFYIIPKRGED